MNRIIILHFGPLELYPPIQNLLRLLESKNNSKKIYVFTTYTNVRTLKKIVLNSEKIKIIRLGVSGQKLGKIKRYSSYLFFYFGSLWYLLIKKPSLIFYYETISSYSTYLYKRFFNSTVQLYIHYHEYTSFTEYENGMMLSKYFNRCERYLYPIAQWVSHTNEYRMKKFTADIDPIKLLNPRILRNYPPADWFKLGVQKNNSPVNVIYVGSLSMDTMYTKEFADWVIAQNGKINFTIYSYNITTKAKEFLQALGSDWIVLREGVNYEELPLILKQYDVGIILYNGHIDNYIYNAPNKLFEYITSGLDVWFPNNMKGSIPYITNKIYPKVISIDFTQLDTFVLDEAMDKQGYALSDNSYCSEQALAEIVEVLLINNI
jgi:hypothetical protein